MKYKLLASDIDGTLLNGDGALTAPTVTAVKKWLEVGGYFVLSTGRPYEGITKISAALGLQDMPAVLYNGAMVTVGKDIIYSLEIPCDVAKEIVSLGHERDSTMICWSKNKLYAEKDCDKVTFYKSISGVEPVFVSDLTSVCQQGITKFVWYDDPVSTQRFFEELKPRIGHRVNVHPSRADFLEFVNKDCSKATAIDIILNRLGLKREQSVAVGDGFNDLAMLTYAGLGVAMANAPDAVKKECGYVTLSCNEDGVSHLVDKLIKGDDAL